MRYNLTIFFYKYIFLFILSLGVHDVYGQIEGNDMMFFIKKAFIALEQKHPTLTNVQLKSILIQSEKIENRLLNVPDTILADLYSLQGNCLIKLQQQEAAHEKFGCVLALRKKAFANIQSADIGHTYYNLARTLHLKRAQDTARMYYENALAYPISKGIRVDVYQKLANIYYSTGDFEKAKQLYFQLLTSTNQKKQQYYFGIATCYRKVGALLDSALYFQKLALQHNPPDSTIFTSSCFSEIGKIFWNKNMLDSADIYLQRAVKMRENSKNIQDEWQLDLMNINSERKGCNVPNSLKKLHILIAHFDKHTEPQTKMRAYRLQGLLLENRPSELKLVLRSYIIAISYADTNQGNFLWLYRDYTDALWQFAKQTNRQNDHLKAQKAALYLQKKIEKSQKKLQNSPKDLAEFHNAARSLIDILVEMYGKNGQIDSCFIFAEYTKAAYIKQKIAKKYSFAPSKVTINDVQKQLSPQQIAIMYHLTKDSIYIFVLSNVEKQLKIIHRRVDFDSLVYNFYSLISTRQRPLNNENARKFAQYSHELYQQLIAPIAERLREKKELYIVPDGFIAYIPFDALLTKPIPDATRLQELTEYYLIHQYIISYQYTAAMFLPTFYERGKAYYTQNMFGIAPVFHGKDTLMCNQAELKVCEKIIGGTMLLGENATKSNFYTRLTASQYAILHFSTHGIATDTLPEENSYLLFAANTTQKTEKMLIRELDTLTLSNELVLLSACETSVGRIFDGEGMLNIGRTFVASGAQSTIASLWKLDDAHSVDFFKDFYTHLKAGKPRFACLRDAKIALMEKNYDPYFWATMTGFGKTTPINLRPKINEWIWNMVMVLVIIGIGYFAKRRFYRGT